jgi:hypothetical protein
MDDFPERRGPMSKMCGLLTFGWQVELENEAMILTSERGGARKVSSIQILEIAKCGEVDRSEVLYKMLGEMRRSMERTQC